MTILDDNGNTYRTAGKVSKQAFRFSIAALAVLIAFFLGMSKPKPTENLGNADQTFYRNCESR